MRIDVEEAFKQKNPKLHRKIPGFVFNKIRRLIHEEGINKFINEYENEPPIPFAIHGLEDLFKVNIEVINEENMPKTGRYIIVSNHPLGGLDGLAMISLLGRYRSDIKLPVNDLLMQIKPLHGVFTPINKHGRNRQGAIQQLNDIFSSDDLVIYFPAGLCSRKQKGKICDLDWKKTIITKAKEYQRDIIPVYFDGKNSNRFYNLANFRKKIGIKSNIEMIYLPDEMFRQTGKKFTIVFGNEIKYTTFDNSKSEMQWAQWLKEQVYDLQKKHIKK